jgi:hypothetical protein
MIVEENNSEKDEVAVKVEEVNIPPETLNNTIEIEIDYDAAFKVCCLDFTNSVLNF